jgi:hypothetical protein
MKKLLIALLLLCSTLHSFSQNDMLVLQKRDRTIQTWIRGSVINFQFSSKQWLQGIIKIIKHDSLTIELIRLDHTPNMLGTFSLDTAKLGLIKFAVKEIYGMPNKSANGNFFTNGALFMLGSSAYIALNLFNTLIHKEALFASPNGARLGIAAGVFGAGLLLSSSQQDYVVIGKKYTMKTIPIGK